MNGWRSTGALFVVFALVGACGGKSDEGQDAGSDAAPSDAQPLDPGCPKAMPNDGSACTHEGFKCEYGNDPRWTCNLVAWCQGGAWSVSTTNEANCPTPSQNPQACPATYATASQSGACTALGTACDYTQGWCACIDLGGPPMFDASGPQAMWQCSFNASTGCPATRPHLGTTCTTPSLECDYGVCGVPSGTSVRCDEKTGTWLDGFGALCAGANHN